MKYEKEEVIRYLNDIKNVVFQRESPERSERLASPEFSVLCKDLIESMHDMQNNGMEFGVDFTDEMLQSVYEGRDASNHIVSNYFIAVGVVAASIELREQPKALAYAMGFHGSKSTYFAIDQMKFGYRAKLSESSYKSFPFAPCPQEQEFSRATEGYALLSDGAYFHHARKDVLVHESGKIATFLEALERTRNFAPEWGQNVKVVKERYSELADVIGRKNDDLQKIFRLVNDGSPSVSIQDCVKATHAIADALTNPRKAQAVNFSAAIDVLDEHPRFWQVAFQEELRSKLPSGYPLMEEVRHWNIEDRMAFKKNLSELNSRMQEKVVDPDVVLASVLLGNYISESLMEKDRAQGDPRWLERSILEKSRDLYALREPTSSLSIVMDALLERTGEEATKEFWQSCESTRGFPVRERWRTKDLGDDQGPGL